MRTVWIGTFPPAGAGTPAGQGEGIWRASFDGATLRDLDLAVATHAPTFLAAHPSGRWVYAGNEEDPGTVTAFEVDGRGLVARGAASSGGAHPCHLALSPDARRLYVANYSSGTLGVLALDDDGALRGADPVQVLGFEGTGPDASRQESSHAHFVAVVPQADGGPSGDQAREAGSAGEVVVVDLGADVLRHHGVRPDGALELVGLTHLPPGTGPRHVAVSADGRYWYVVGELDATLHVLERTAGGLVSRQVVSLAGERAERTEHGWALPEGRLLASHVELVGDRLLAGMRVDNRLEELRVRHNGTLVPVRTMPLAGWPRHFAVVGQHVLVAGQTSHAVEICAPDGSRTEVALPAPACIVPV